MLYPNKALINFFRGALVLILILNIFNGAIAEHPRFSSISSWGTVWQGLFLTAFISWLLLEVSNFYLKKTRVGHLPAYFWVVATGLIGADFFNSYSGLFEVANFDKGAHAAGGFFFGLLMLGLIKRINRSYDLKLTKTLIYYLAFASVNLGGIVYEIGELIGDRFFGSHNITGIFDTSEDLIFNNIGLILLLLIDWVLHRIEAGKKRAPDIS